MSLVLYREPMKTIRASSSRYNFYKMADRNFLKTTRSDVGCYIR